MATVRFHGYGPETSIAQIHRTDDKRIVLAESPQNGGTSLINAFASCISTVCSQYDDITPATPIFLWTPNDPVVGASMWQATRSDDMQRNIGNLYDFEPVEWENDPALVQAVASFVDSE